MSRSNIKIFGPIGKDPKNERYHQRIAELEGEVSTLRGQLEMVSQNKNLEAARSAQEKEKYLAALSNFLTNLYSQLGKIQNDILRQSIGINEHIANQSELKVAAYTKELSERNILLLEED